MKNFKEKLNILIQNKWSRTGNFVMALIIPIFSLNLFLFMEKPVEGIML